MKTKIGIMGSADETHGVMNKSLMVKAHALGETLATSGAILLSGATTGVVHAVGKSAHETGVFHVGISPAAHQQEHVETYNLPIDACDVIVYTGFGLKGRNVVLVRTCDIVLFLAGGMGSLNEFTIAHDENKIIGCLTGTGGVADQADYLLKTFSKAPGARVLQNNDPAQLLDDCFSVMESSREHLR
jgi:uncharacterized protein (TIGR00725 family)